MDMEITPQITEDEEIRNRAAAIVAMGKTGDRDAIKSLVMILGNREEVDWLRACAAIALGRLAGDEVATPLIDALDDDSSIVKRAAITALGEARSEKAIPVLQAIMEDNAREGLHAVTINVLSIIGGEGSVPVIMKSLESPNVQVRRRAALALGELRAKAAVQSLIGLMNDSDESLRAVAASSLGLMGDQRAAAALIKALDDGAESVRVVAASSLGYLGESKAIPALEKALKEGSKLLRKQAATALSKLRKQKIPNKGV